MSHPSGSCVRWKHASSVNRETHPSVVASGDGLGEFDALVRAALADGAVEFADVTAGVLQALPAELYCAATGQVADGLARLTRVAIRA